MDINLVTNLSKDYTNVKVTIEAPEMNDDIKMMVDIIKSFSNSKKNLISYSDGKKYILSTNDILFIETINEQVSTYKSEDDTISSATYSKLLSELAFYTTFISLASLWGAIVFTIVSNVVLAIFDKVSTNKLNKQLQKHQ